VVAVALGLAAGISWGVADFLGGLKTRQLNVLAVLLISQATGMLLVAIAVVGRGEGPPDTQYLVYGVLAGLSGLIGLAAFYRGMALGAMSVVAPISASGAAIPVVVGLATGDRPSALQGVGLVVALVGVAMASRERTVTGGQVAAGTGMALAAAVGFGGFFVGMDAASDRDVLWAIFAARTPDVLLLAVLIAAMRPSLGMTAIDARDIAAVGIFDVGANALFAVASTQGLVSLVAVLASLYPVATILLARAVLGERIAPIQAAGVILALLGVAAIAGG
jgi:drug/metabolite transporter (DMT)-like permease